jgi:predicted Rossmann fold flavoprotein
LRSWPLEQQRRFFEEELALPLVVEPETGKLFPVSNSARTVREALVREALSRGVEWRPKVRVLDLVRDGTRWKILIDHAEPIIADAVIIATGGLSVPQTGSDGFGLDLLARLGHTIHPTYPALTPLTLDPPVFADLAGISLPVTINGSLGREKRETSDGFLFTHRGYSGPAVLDISDLAVRSRLGQGPRAEFRVSWGGLTAIEWESRLAPGATTVASAVRHELPSRLADRLLLEAGVTGSTSLAQLTRPARRNLLQLLVAYPLPWTGDAGFQKAEVTGGGVALGEIDARTLESRLLPGIFLCGELLDAFGPIGGYNFVWAWVTGRLAGRGVHQVLRQHRSFTP